jgi:hypothetical protein
MENRGSIGKLILIFLAVIGALGVIVTFIALLVNWLYDSTIGKDNSPSSNIGGFIVFALVVILFFAIWDNYDNNSRGASEFEKRIIRTVLRLGLLSGILMLVFFFIWGRVNPPSDFEKCVSQWESYGLGPLAAEEKCS